MRSITRFSPWCMLGGTFVAAWMIFMPWLLTTMIAPEVFQYETSFLGELRQVHERLNKATPGLLMQTENSLFNYFILGIIPVSIYLVYLFPLLRYTRSVNQTRILAMFAGSLPVIVLFSVWPTAMVEALADYQPRIPEAVETAKNTCEEGVKLIDASVKVAAQAGKLAKEKSQTYVCEKLGLFCEEGEETPTQPQQFQN